MGSAGCPSASRKATEKAALDERPAPTGTVLFTVMAPPVGGGHWRKRPAARRAWGGTDAVVPVRGISRDRPGNWSDSTPTRKLSGFGVNVTSVARSMARGSERPWL